MGGGCPGQPKFANLPSRGAGIREAIRASLNPLTWEYLAGHTTFSEKGIQLPSVASCRLPPLYGSPSLKALADCGV